MHTIPSESQRAKPKRRRRPRDARGRRVPLVKLDGKVKFLLALVSAIIATAMFCHTTAFNKLPDAPSSPSHKHK